MIRHEFISFPFLQVKEIWVNHKVAYLKPTSRPITKSAYFDLWLVLSVYHQNYQNPQTSTLAKSNLDPLTKCAFQGMLRLITYQPLLKSL